MTTSSLIADSKGAAPGVAFVAPLGLTVGGVTTWTLEMCRRLPRLGHRVALIQHDCPMAIPVDDSTRPEYQTISCDTAFSVKISRRNLAAYASALPAMYVPNWSDGTYATCARLSRDHAENMRVLGFCHTCHRYYFQWLRFYEPLIHRFIAVSEECAWVLKAKLPARAKDILVRPYAVERPRALDRAYAAPGQPIRLLYAGRIVEQQKRVSDLLRLAKALHRRRVDFQLRIIGEGSAKSGLSKGIRRLPGDLSRRISLEGEMAPSRIPGELSSADLCLLVSEYEGMSIFMLEGMAAGCVPVVTQVSGTAGVIDHGDNGFTVPVGNVEEMARVIQGLDKDRSLLQRVGVSAHAKLCDSEYSAYLSWFDGVVKEVWADRPRAWPARRPLFPTGTLAKALLRAAIRKGRSLAATIPDLMSGWSWLRSHLP
jgi:glycosyltransferase involved in cell wall biosynthesis